jgi:hypothetical protein
VFYVTESEIYERLKHAAEDPDRYFPVKITKPTDDRGLIPKVIQIIGEALPNDEYHVRYTINAHETNIEIYRAMDRSDGLRPLAQESELQEAEMNDGLEKMNTGERVGKK